MPFIEQMKQYEQFDFTAYLAGINSSDIESILCKERINRQEFLALLSAAGSNSLEKMAQKAHFLTRQYFGQTISLYIPLYLANFCDNSCVYCGFNRENPINRQKLSYAQINSEAEKIARSGINQVLLLTGESRQVTPPAYLAQAVSICKKYFSSVAIEMFPMSTREYQLLKEAGAGHLTIYQEVYDREIYREVHPAGQKSDYHYRLHTPERGAGAGFYSVSVGTLLGLADFRKEIFFLGLHARYLLEQYPGLEVHLSLPRINAASGGFLPRYSVTDFELVQILCALRLFLPRAGINLSTREKAKLRDHLLPLGITRLSAGSKTSVGGYAGCQTTQKEVQFEIEDRRSIDEICRKIQELGYQPVFPDRLEG